MDSRFKFRPHSVPFERWSDAGGRVYAPLVAREQCGRGFTSEMLVSITLRADAEDSLESEVTLSRLPRKTSSEDRECPYCKPTQVGR